jgi:chemotaxis protein CheD
LPSVSDFKSELILAQFSTARAPVRGGDISVHQGDCPVTGDPDVTYSTVLGSCISACVRDRRSKIGGMNHFLLAAQSASSRDKFGESARYGAFAMEQLINMVLSQGTGDKSFLEIKVFGGGNINSAITDVGAVNAEFVREFLGAEGYTDFSHDLGGPYARRVLFQPFTGKAFVKRLDSTVNEGLVREEIAVAGRTSQRPATDDIELF